MKNKAASTMAILVLLPLPILYACENRITDLDPQFDFDDPIRGTKNLVVYPDLLALRPGESTQLGAFLAKPDPFLNPGEIDVEWGSSDPAVVSVSPTGRITAQKHGVAHIYAEFGEWGGEAVVAVNEDARIPDHLRR
ncbi:MAG: hypothetical protein HKO65_07955 [Gemmatimonadetes bacterium]|nr:Ig-like domain-containing protein [Gemmatimonadota bacterium]NNM05024.1 hypothetical protein [Gemmatimonadota bacterium]